MKSAANLAVLALLSLAISCAAQSSPVKDIQTFYDKQSALTLKMDAAALARLVKARYTDDFKNIGMPNPSGTPITMDRTQTIETMKGALRGPPSFTKWVTHINSATRGTVAIVVNVTTTTSSLIKGTGEDQSHTVTIIQTGDDSWVKIAGIWKLRKSKALKMQYIMDGKPIG